MIYLSFKRRTLRSLVVGLICVIFAAAASPAAHASSGDPDPTVRLSQGEQWTLGKTKAGELKAGKLKAGEFGPDASGWSWACRGTFAAPDLSTVAGFTWGAYQQCSSSIPQQVSIKINLCVQDAGGPSQFHCDVYKGARAGALVTAYQTRTNAYISGCNRSKTSKFVQVAYSIMADYKYYASPVESNQTEIRCGF